MRGSVNSYAAIKQLTWESQFKDWESYRRLELDLQETLAYKEDFKEGFERMQNDVDQCLREINFKLVKNV